MNIEDLKPGELYYARRIDYTVDETTMYMFVECGYEGIAKEIYDRDFPFTKNKESIKGMKYYLFYHVDKNKFVAFRLNDNEQNRFQWIRFLVPNKMR